MLEKTATLPDEAWIFVYRGDTVESRHRISFAAADAAGEIVHAGGKTDRPIFPRSAIKMLQAIPLVETGAADRFGLTAKELALACASHNGEPSHVDTVGSWLQRLGFSSGDLECGAHPPVHAPSARTLINSGSPPTGLHNNCSGKHAGMLTLAKHLGVDPRGYRLPDHPVQIAIAEALEAMTDVSPWPDPAIDGCGIPTFPIPLTNFAMAMARFGSPSDLNPPRAEACEKIANAMMQHPDMVAGQDRPCTMIMRALPGVVVKTGAEGAYAAAWPERGLGLALKVEDGTTRASSVALMALLDSLGAVSESARERLKDVARPTLKNHAGTVVGHIEPCSSWTGLAATA